MAESTPQLKKIVIRYRTELSCLGIQVTEVFVYGSHASCTQREGSDIDLIVVSPDFARLNTRERLELLGIAAARVLEPIQAYGLTPKEIEQQALTPFWFEILTHEAVPIS